MKNFIAACLLLATLAGCKEDAGVIGLDLQPGGEALDLNVNDTLSLVTTTIAVDSVKTDELSQNILGSYNDPLFGKVSTQVLTEFRLPENNLNFGTSPVLDSVVLVFRFNGNKANYGQLDAQKFKVCKLNDRIYADRSYTNNSAFSIDVADISYHQAVQALNLTDSITVAVGNHTEKRPPHLRIRLSDAFGNTLLNTPGANYASDEAFLNNVLKGIAIIPDNPGQSAGQGGIVGLDLQSAISGLVVYYNDTMQKTFIVTSSSARIGVYQHSNKNTQLTGQISNPGNYDTTFVQSLGVARTKIQVPHLYGVLNDRKTLINMAELIIPVYPNTVDVNYKAPSRLGLFAIDETGGQALLTDELDNPTRFGGFYDSASASYHFVITRHIQQLISNYLMQGKDLNRGFYLIVPTDNPYTASRAMLDTRKNPTRRIRLKLTYTKTN